MKKILFILSAGFLLLQSCKESKDSLPTNTPNSLLESKIDGAITISADGMSRYPNSHTIKVSSSFLDDSKKEKGSSNMRIGTMDIPLSKNKEENFEILTFKEDNYPTAKKLYGSNISLSALLPIANKNARISSQDFYSPEVLNMDISSNKGINLKEFQTNKDFVIQWNVDAKNTNPLFFAVTCDPNGKEEYDKKLIVVKKQVDDVGGKVIFSKDDFSKFPKGKKVLITGGRGNKSDMLIDGKNIRVSSYSTSVELSLISK